MVRFRAFAAAMMMSAAIGACAAPASSNATPIWLHIVATEDGVAYRVGNEVVNADQLDAALLRHAAEANPGMTETQLREEVRIYLRADPEVELRDVVQTIQSINLERIGIVAEDAR